MELKKTFGVNTKRNEAILEIRRRNYRLLVFIDDYSHYISNYELFQFMDGGSIALEAQRAFDKLPSDKKHIVQSDNGSCIISNDFARVLKACDVVIGRYILIVLTNLNKHVLSELKYGEKNRVKNSIHLIREKRITNENPNIKVPLICLTFSQTFQSD